MGLGCICTQVGLKTIIFVLITKAHLHIIEHSIYMLHVKVVVQLSSPISIALVEQNEINTTVKLILK